MKHTLAGRKHDFGFHEQISTGRSALLLVDQYAVIGVAVPP
jgi:hypothetical protein